MKNNENKLQNSIVPLCQVHVLEAERHDEPKAKAQINEDNRAENRRVPEGTVNKKKLRKKKHFVFRLSQVVVRSQ